MNAILLAMAMMAATGADVDAAPTPTPTSAAPDLRLSPASPSSAASLALPGLLLAGLAAAALLLRRRKAGGGLVRVLETQSLGARRALVVVRLGDEVLLLGSAEGGITLLRAQPASAAAELATDAVAAELEAPAPSRAAPAPGRSAPAAARPIALAGLAARLRAVRGAPPAAPAFDALLAESAEDQELRRKLARGQPGSVR